MKKFDAVTGEVSEAFISDIIGDTMAPEETALYSKIATSSMLYFRTLKHKVAIGDFILKTWPQLADELLVIIGQSDDVDVLFINARTHRAQNVSRAFKSLFVDKITLDPNVDDQSFSPFDIPKVNP